MDKRKRRLLCMLEGSGRKSRWISGAPPLSFKAFAAGELENYRIYGNTVDGESVGDRTGNLAYKRMPNTSVYANGKVIEENGFDLVIAKVAASETYTVNGIHGVLAFFVNEPALNAYSYDSSRVIVGSNTQYTFIVPLNCNYVAVRVLSSSEAMLNSGSEPLPYEPYGYKVPVTVSNGTDTLTTPIYLPEQIKMVGEEAEYVDYAEQKMHRIGADDIDVTLPALPTLPGTNVLSVGTAVQPSEIEIKGKIKAL